MKKFAEFCLIVALLAAISVCAFSCTQPAVQQTMPNDRFDLTNQVIDFIEKNYYGDIDYDLADVYAAYGLVASLGNYNYINPISDLLGASSDGKGFGLIVRNTKYNEHLIDFILDGSPFLSPSEGILAQRGDEIYAVDGERVSGLDTTAYAAIISALPSDRAVVFTLKRGDEKYDVSYQKVDFAFPQCIYIDDLSGVPNEFGYICLRSFDNTTNVVDEFKNAVKSFNEDGNRALILDLRGNGGGSSEVFKNVASALIGKDSKPGEPLLEIHYQKSDRSSVVTSIAVEDKITAPIYVLCNGGTASASEALIGTMKAHGTLRALIGQDTVGKGVAQNGFTNYEEGENGYLIDKGVGEEGVIEEINAYLVRVVVGKYYIYDKSAEGGKYCMHENPFTPDIPITGENVISPDYGEDLYIRAAVEHYNGQKTA